MNNHCFTHHVSVVHIFGVSVIQGLICTSIYEYAFGALHFCPDKRNVYILGSLVKGVPL